MTTFTIPAETYLRLSGVAVQPDEETNRPWMRSVRIEHKNNRCIALAANGPLIAGEFIQDIDEPDASICVSIDPALIDLARGAAAIGDNLVINQAPGWTVITTGTGVMYAGNGEVPGEWPDWRALLPADLPTKNNGCFSFTGVNMARLCKSAPSGAIRCSKYIDMSVPTVVRDLRDDGWFGVFLVSDSDKAQSFKPATIPDFLK